MYAFQTYAVFYVPVLVSMLCQILQEATSSFDRCLSCADTYHLIGNLT